MLAWAAPLLQMLVSMACPFLKLRRAFLGLFGLMSPLRICTARSSSASQSTDSSQALQS